MEFSTWAVAIGLCILLWYGMRRRKKKLAILPTNRQERFIEVLLHEIGMSERRALKDYGSPYPENVDEASDFIDWLIERKEEMSNA